MFNDKKREVSEERESKDLKEAIRTAREEQVVEAGSTQPREKVVTIIGEGTVITGDIRAENDLSVLGKVEGNAECMADMQVKGEIRGNIKAENLLIDKSEVVGDISCKNQFQLTGGTGLLGNIEAGSASVEGSVKGNITVQSKIVLSEQARIEGDIIAGMIEVKEGAEIQGNMKIGKLHKQSHEQHDGLDQHKKISGGYVKRNDR